MKQFLIYGTSGCHLCEEAEALLYQLRDESEEAVNWDYIDISERTELLEHFELIIPVIEDPISKKQLQWPFSKNKLADFVLEALA